ncbi:MAG: hypothetical protein IT497_03730 [Ottowia sp.]|nr:hypothetical protein [Ottowia sp.]
MKNSLFKKWMGYAIVAVLVSITGFTLHILDVEILRKYLSGQPIGLSYSWSITALAAISAIEYGIGLVVLYRFTRRALLSKKQFTRALFLALLILLTKTSLLRGMLMSAVLGGFNRGLLVDMVPWIIALSSCFVLVYTYERWVVPHDGSHSV